MMSSMCGSRGGGQGIGTPPPEKSQNVGLTFLSILVRISFKTYQASIQCLATIYPAKRHLIFLNIFFSTFWKITVGEFVNRLIKIFWPKRSVCESKSRGRQNHNGDEDTMTLTLTIPPAYLSCEFAFHVRFQRIVRALSLNCV